jgi:hemoglobin-like flavoprotein
MSRTGHKRRSVEITHRKRTFVGARVGAALLRTLEKGLGADFTPPLKTAWTEAYMTLAGVMQKAAATVPAPAVKKGFIGRMFG